MVPHASAAHTYMYIVGSTLIENGVSTEMGRHRHSGRATFFRPITSPSPPSIDPDFLKRYASSTCTPTYILRFTHCFLAMATPSASCSSYL